jgi:hypothetical protein
MSHIMEDISGYYGLGLDSDGDFRNSRGQTSFGIGGPTFIHLGLLGRLVLDLELVT